MTARNNIIDFGAFAARKSALSAPAMQLDNLDHHWDTDDLKRLLFNDAGPIETKVSAPSPLPLVQRIIWN